MTPSILAACLWVILGAITAALPFRLQMVPGFVLLATALPLLVWIGAQNGWLWTLVGLMAFVSMFRRPLLHLLRRLRDDTREAPR